MDRRPRLPTFTSLERVRFWLSDYGLAFAVVAGLCLLFAVLATLALRSIRGPVTLEEAQVVRFGYHEGKTWRRPLVVVRMRDGAVRQLLATRQSLRHCHRGDPITLVHRGHALFVHQQGCLRAGPGRRPPA